jgi:hypothetical protein
MSWMLTKQQSHPRQAERRCILGRTAAAMWLLVIGFTGEAQAEDARPRATMAAERSLMPGGDGSRTGSLEDQAVCGLWTERLLAALYHLAAGRPDAARVRGIPGLERVTFLTRDGRRRGGDKLGGVFLLHAFAAGVGYDAALIDAAPSRISGYGCPPRFDPVENLPRDGARLGFLFGHRDTVVPPGAGRELSETARARGAVVFERADLAHPLMDLDPWTRQARFDLVRAFFAGRAR